MTRISTSCSSRWVAKLWRNVCGLTRFLMPAASAASWTARLIWRVEMGSIEFCPGNNQPWEQPTLGQHHAAPLALTPPEPQQFQQLRRQHGIAVLVSLALFDPDQHVGAWSVAFVPGAPNTAPIVT